MAAAEADPGMEITAEESEAEKEETATVETIYRVSNGKHKWFHHREARGLRQLGERRSRLVPGGDRPWSQPPREETWKRLKEGVVARSETTPLLGSIRCFLLACVA